MALLKINRGLEANLSKQIVDGNIYFCTDTGNLYIDYETSRVHINANKAQSLIYYDKDLDQYIDIDANYLMELLQTKATSIYIQPDEPVDAPEGSLWIQISEDESEDEENSDEIIITVNGISPDVNGNIEVPIPEKLPNPQKLIFTGNVNKNYDGSTEVSVDIPKEITVNGKNADENGNIEIDIPIEITVNGKSPDENGNIEINFSVNGNEADENGNINLNIPDAQQQSDWNQNNSSNITFIKNRTHWEETINGVSTVHPLDDKFIPNSIARVSDIPDAILNPGAAAVGQTIVVKAIDENGKPIEWEVIDFPEVDLTGYYTKEEIDVLLDNYITTVDTLIGEEE